MAAGTTKKASSVGEPGNLVVEAWRRATGWWRTWERTGERVAAWEMASYGGLLITALAMRLWDLGSRAMHHDESLHAFYSWLLSEGSGYQHSPMMHGPFQFEANAGLFLAFGDSDFTARLLYAVAGTILVGMPLLFRFRLGRGGALLVAGLLASSPTLLYFSRFARNDIIMAVWTLGLVISMWRYIDEGKNRYLYVSSALLALMFATKETSFIATSVLGLFLALTVIKSPMAIGTSPALRCVSGMVHSNRLVPPPFRRAVSIPRPQTCRRRLQSMRCSHSMVSQQARLARLQTSALTKTARSFLLHRH